MFPERVIRSDAGIGRTAHPEGDDPAAQLDSPARTAATGGSPGGHELASDRPPGRERPGGRGRCNRA